MKTRHLIVLPLLSIAAFALSAETSSAQGNSKCPKNPSSCSQLKECPRADSWQVDYKALDKLRRKGCESPLEWRDRKGKAVQSGGVGSVGMTARAKPTQIPTQSGSGAGGGAGGGGGGGSGGGGGGGDGGDGEKECPGTYPPPLDACHIEGERAPLKSGATAPQCGASVALSSEWLTLVNNANAAVFAQQDSYDLKGYTRRNNDYSYAGASKIPSFYCKLKEIPDASRPSGKKIIAEKIAITPHSQYNELSSAIKEVAISVAHTDGTQILSAEDDNFIVMKRNGNFTFNAPAPNPGWFKSRKAEDVDPKCYTPEQLLDPIPHNFGDVRFRNLKQESCTVEHLFPTQCKGYTHYVNLQHMQMLFSEKQTMQLGAITGSETFSTHTVASTEGDFVTDPTSGNISYTGSSIMVRGGQSLYIGSGLTSSNKQAFLGGARVRLYNDHMVRINAPGRVNMMSDGRMQLIDGGVVESSQGVQLRTLSPMAFVNFKEPSKPMLPIKGSLNSQIKISGNSLIPAEKGGVIQLPFDTFGSVQCHTAGE